MSVRTRFAPSPSGPLHLGNARTAVLNWAFARHHGGDFVLRFEDTDLERNVETAEERILEGLRWLGLDPDEGPDRGGAHGPYRQSERSSHYSDHVASLLLEGAAYNCYCTPDELERRRQEALEEGRQPTYDGRCRELDPAQEERFRSEGRRPSVRFKVAPGPVPFTDRVRGEVSIDGSEFGDFVILRSDGRPTYNFAAAVDDILMEITHVIRGVDHLANTPKQLLLYDVLDAEPPEFAHIPLVLAPGGEQMTKRGGARPLQAYREEGVHPNAVVNYLSLLSWSSPSGDEFLGRDRIVREIDLGRIGRSDAEVDPEKMRWLSGRHIAREDPERLAERARPFLEGIADLDDRDRRALAEVLRGRIQLLSEASEEARRLFPEPEYVGRIGEVLHEPGALGVLRAAGSVWSDLDGWERDRIRGTMDAVADRSGVRGRELYHPLRAALTGALEGPELPDVAYVLGRKRALDRLQRATGVAAAGETSPDGQHV